MQKCNSNLKLIIINIRKGRFIGKAYKSMNFTCYFFLVFKEDTF